MIRSSPGIALLPAESDDADLRGGFSSSPPPLTHQVPAPQTPASIPTTAEKVIHEANPRAKVRAVQDLFGTDRAVGGDARRTSDRSFPLR